MTMDINDINPIITPNLNPNPYLNPNSNTNSTINPSLEFMPC